MKDAFFDEEEIKRRAAALQSPRIITRGLPGMCVVVRYGDAYVEPQALRFDQMRDNGRKAFAAICEPRTCPTCKRVYAALKISPPDIECLRCVEAREAQRAPALPGVA